MSKNNYTLKGEQRLCGSEVHIWAVKLVASEGRIRQLSSSLSADENCRASSFRLEHLRTRFVIRRGMLRTLIGAYLDVPPDEIRFCYAPSGKPSLVEHNGLHFNMSHSGEVAVFGFTTAYELGIDIESIRHIPNLEGIARGFFSPEEAMDLATVEASQRLESFFACWTRKEAYVKATGEGLSTPLDSFRVTLRPTEAAALINVGGDISEASSWSMYHLTPAPGYVACLAFRGPRRAVRMSPCESVEQTLMQLADPGEAGRYLSKNLVTVTAPPEKADPCQPQPLLPVQPSAH